MCDKLEIMDYEIIKDIDLIVDLPIIILGAGRRGSKVIRLLKDATLNVAYIYDRSICENNYMGTNIISFDELSQITKMQDFLIVIAIEKCVDEMLEELTKREIKAIVCTWYGIQTAIEININNEFFPQIFREDFIHKKSIYSENFGVEYRLRMYTEMCKCRNPILIYQPAKVGSTSIKVTLDRYNVENVHVHNIMQNERHNIKFKPSIVDLLNEQSRILQKSLLNNNLKIITLVREPVSRSLSHFIQEFDENYIVINTDEGLPVSANKFVLEQLETNYEFEWFNKELKAFTGIDIYEVPFDKERGYTFIKRNNIEILIMKMERLNENMQIIGEFVGIQNFELINKNIGAEKYYRYIYQKLQKELIISEKILYEQYENNNYFSHFYSDEEKNIFLKKWVTNRE